MSNQRHGGAVAADSDADRARWPKAELKESKKTTRWRAREVRTGVRDAQGARCGTGGGGGCKTPMRNASWTKNGGAARRRPGRMTRLGRSP
ncbi:hypothetical protein Sjap_014377 [Stephania japonica]|uniref:Uncharacterized protein n=1 Tax=Stephania japonica TaxID=461633 RepID=A0AAP0J0J7_9MAGN